jgi:hypothetical protein
MQKNDLGGMSADELWDLHLEVSELLRKRLTAELFAIEQKLEKLRARSGTASERRPRRNAGAARVKTEKALAADRDLAPRWDEVALTAA